MADRTLTINHADGDSETYTINRDKFAGVRTMTVDGSDVNVDHTAVPKERARETTFGGSQSITIQRDIEPLLSEVSGGAAAAYSLRDLNDKQGNNKVVRVRRESDNAERDFTASEVSDGTLEDWVGASPADPENIASFDAIFGGTGFSWDGTFIFQSANNRWFRSGTSNNVIIEIPTAGPNVGKWVVFSDYDYEEGVTSLASDQITDYPWQVTSWTPIAGEEGTPDGNVSFSNFVGGSPTEIGNDGFVETWYDQSGNGNDAEQPVATNQPKIVDGGSLATVGIDFDGHDDALIFNTSIIITDNAAVFTAASASSTGSSVNFLGRASSADGIGIYQNLLFCRGMGSGAAGSFTTTANSNQKIISFLIESNNGSVFQDSVASSSNTKLHDGSTRVDQIGGGLREVFAGAAAELIIYDSDQSANRPAIETNINNHYNIF